MFESNNRLIETHQRSLDALKEENEKLRRNYLFMNERLNKLESEKTERILHFGETKRIIPAEGSKPNIAIDPQLIQSLIEKEVAKRLAETQGKTT